MPQFEKTTVHMRDPERVEQIMCSLIKGGASKLQVKLRSPDISHCVKQHPFVVLLHTVLWELKEFLDKCSAF